MGALQTQGVDERGQAVREVGQAEGLGRIRGAPESRRVPRHDRELVG
jgi:hypothetical protein